MKSKLLLGLVCFLGLSSQVAMAQPGFCYEIIGKNQVGQAWQSIQQMRLPVSVQTLCLQKAKAFGGGDYASITLYNNGKAFAQFAATEIQGKCYNANCNVYVLQSGQVASLGNVSDRIKGASLAFNEPHWQIAVDSQVFSIARTK